MGLPVVAINTNLPFMLQNPIKNSKKAGATLLRLANIIVMADHNLFMNERTGLWWMACWVNYSTFFASCSGAGDPFIGEKDMA
jgi:hypothetical protein